MLSDSADAGYTQLNYALTEKGSIERSAIYTYDVVNMYIRLN